MIAKNLMDIRIPVKIRVGTKMISMDELSKLTSGSVIEMEQLANNPLQILADDVVIAEGEVVIVDGMYGVQVTKLLDEALYGYSNDQRE